MGTTSEVSLTDSGQLQINTPLGSLIDDAPIAYQEIAGKRIPVSKSYILEEAHCQHPPAHGHPKPVSFKLGSYDVTYPLVMDPAWLIYCGYIGGALEDRASGIAVDEAGNAYIKPGRPIRVRRTGFPF